MDPMACIARKTGMTAKEYMAIFKDLMSEEHDSLWIDMSAKTPYPLRKNGYTLIKK